MSAVGRHHAESSDLTDRLIAIWERTLQVAPVTPESDFFDLGGDSLMAVGLFLEIERETGRNFPITTIYDAPTIVELSALIESDAQADYSPFVLLKDGPGEAPLYIVHGIGGSVIDLASLGRLIETSNPVYAIQARGLDGRDAPFTSVDEMADFYFAAIKQKQPSGPYLLSGYSFGGLVALEIARRMERAGDAVAMVLMIDAYAHPRSWPKVSQFRARTRRLVNRLTLIARQPLPQTLSYVADKVRHKKVRANAAAAPMRSWLGEIDPTLPLPLRQVRYAGDTAVFHHTPKPYGGKITFLRAATTLPVFPRDAHTIWRPMGGQFEMLSTIGNHHTIIGEHVERTAARISLLLERVAAPKVVALQRAARLPVLDLTLDDIVPASYAR